MTPKKNIGHVAVIGGGAAGYFAAIRCAEVHPTARVTIYEKTTKVLTKVKVSGGGRCNVTNGAQYASEVLKGYPRGRSLLKKLFKRFDHKDAQNWFASHSVELKTEADGRVFPVSNNAQDIIDALHQEADKLGVVLRTKMAVRSIEGRSDRIHLMFADDTSATHSHVIIATGGASKGSAYQWLADLGHDIMAPVSSLFTFNMPNEKIKSTCQGIVVQKVQCSIPGVKFKSSGPLLVTHWGMSGPAILKLSSWSACDLAKLNYRFEVIINWLPNWTEGGLVDHFISSKKQMKNMGIPELPKRIFNYFLDRAQVDPEKAWVDQKKRTKNKLLHTLLSDAYHVEGKTTFKEEFVTCGGVSLADIDHSTMESRHVPNLYFAGEVLDIDAVTGGYNFQAAWTTGYVAGELG